MACSTDHTNEKTESTHILSVRSPFRTAQLWRVACTTGMTTDKARASPNPIRAHNEAGNACFHLARIRIQATTQMINVGNCPHTICKNNLVGGMVFMFVNF